MEKEIVVRGAREHNLRSVDLTIPRGKLICFTGVSGSGKSSMAFDTLYAEGQRRYLESLSSYARQFVGQLPKPDVDFLSGLSPSISISQKSTGNNPRSTVGTITEIQDFLRVLFARVGTCFCPNCNIPIEAQTRDQIVAKFQQFDPDGDYIALAPLIRGQKGEHRDLFEDLRKQGFSRARVDGQLIQLSSPPSLDRQLRHHIEVVIDRLSLKSSGRQRIAEAIETALRVGEGTLIISTLLNNQSAPDADVIISSQYACPSCGDSFEPPSPQLFSFNSPQGMCPTCDGIGQRYTFDPDLLIPDPSKSISNGAVILLGRVSEWSRATRQLLRGVAAASEKLFDCPKDYMLKTPWKKLTEEQQSVWLHGLGNQNLVLQRRGGKRPKLYGAQFSGLIEKFLSEWNNSKSMIMRRFYEKCMQTLPCEACSGQRLNPHARNVKLASTHSRWKSQPWLSLPEVCELSLEHCLQFFQSLQLNDLQSFVAGEALKEIHARLGFLLEVGLAYLCLARTAPTLSGGESQRIRLASQIGSGLVGVLYVLDEPSIGLHPRDNDRLLASLQRLRDLGNTLIVVEHDEDTMRTADLLVDFGPGPGVRGGYVVAQGSLAEIKKSKDSLTGGYLSGRLSLARQLPPRPRKHFLRIEGASHNNLKNVDVEIPLGCLVCVTGVSGSGKSSLVTDILSPALRQIFTRTDDEPGPHKRIVGHEQIDKVIDIDQSPIGRTPRSNPATYVKVLDEIRDLFALLPDSKVRGYQPGRFSFNTDQGRCSACEGNGAVKLAMELVADIWVPCAVCEGKRFDFETLQVQFKGKSIADCLDLDVQQALEHFASIPKIAKKLQTLHDVGLDYLKLGQPSPTLSGGEAQRIKLAKELSRRDTGKTLYILDEPTTGLHFADVAMLLQVLQRLVDRGNTVVVVEHNLDLIQAADWVIDLGPEGGAAGGQVIATATPQDLIKIKKSHTGDSLREYYTPKKTTNKSKLRPKATKAATETSLVVRGAAMHNLQHVDLTLPLHQMSVFCGPSGSGKTSLAFETIYAEGQRRFVESLSSYARQFVGQMPKPVLDGIEGLSPAVALEQKNLGHTPRSTVGTVTEIYDYLRVLLARLGQMHCPTCLNPVGTQTSQEIVQSILGMEPNAKFLLVAPLPVQRGLDVTNRLEELVQAGFVRFRIDGKVYESSKLPTLSRATQYQVQLVVDRLKVDKKDRARLADSVETTLQYGLGSLQVVLVDDQRPEELWKVITHSKHLACHHCHESYQPLTPHSFSFNSYLGWCPSCYGLGTQMGTNIAELINPLLSLAEGGLLIWPHIAPGNLSHRMLESMCRTMDIPRDIPIGSLSSKAMRYLMFGTGDQWFEMPDMPGSQFQFIGVFPLVDLLSRTSPILRDTLNRFTAEVPCSTCEGARVRPEAVACRWRDRTIVDLVHLPLNQLLREVRSWKLNQRESSIAGEILREVQLRLQFLVDVGLDYLHLGRSANSLSGGEAQRIRLASQLGSGLCGVLYVLDEPTIGLHPRDNHRLLSALHKLRDLGNTLVVVEHDRDVIAGADQLCDFGPGSGRNGGHLIAQGTPTQVAKKPKSVTGPFLSGKKSIPIPSNRRPTSPEPPGGNWLQVIGARHNSLKNINAKFPLGCLIAVTGPSGSGKSSLIMDILHPALAQKLHRAQLKPGPFDQLQGTQGIDKVIMVSQAPLGSSPASNPATYSGVFDPIRQLFSKIPDALIRGFTPRHFSFNVPGGRCEKCEGLGQIKIEMHFLPDVWITCEACQGKRFTQEVLSVRYQGHSIHDVLEMQIGQAYELLYNIPKIRQILKTLCDVGLEYISLGQAASTLSGGEAQRVKLAAELARPATGKTLYLLDEPTTGLHFEDIAKLLKVLHRLVDVGNTVIVIEHNLDVIKSADWVLDMGPEAGNEGGFIVAEGTPEQIVAAKGKRPAKVLRSYTAEALTPILQQGPYLPRQPYNPLEDPIKLPEDIKWSQISQGSQPPWESDGKSWHLSLSTGKNNQGIHWDRQLLEKIVDFIASTESFHIDWNHQNQVTIHLDAKTDWFATFTTDDSWLLAISLRIPSNACNPKEIQKVIPLQPLSEYRKIPQYDNTPRLHIQSSQNFSRVDFHPHQLEELDRPIFWNWLSLMIHAMLDAHQRTWVHPPSTLKPPTPKRTAKRAKKTESPSS